MTGSLIIRDLDCFYVVFIFYYYVHMCWGLPPGPHFSSLKLEMVFSFTETVGREVDG